MSACYASIPRTPDLRAVGNILRAVAPGGTLVVLGHDLEAMREVRHDSIPSDPEAYVRVEDFAAALAADAGWTLEVEEKRRRPLGAASEAHHVDDVVLRARRVG